MTLTRPLEGCLAHNHSRLGQPLEGNLVDCQSRLRRPLGGNLADYRSRLVRPLEGSLADYRSRLRYETRLTVDNCLTGTKVDYSLACSSPIFFNLLESFPQDARFHHLEKACGKQTRWISTEKKSTSRAVSLYS